ncbi:ABC transporter substrate-binding protein [Streptomyces phytophilus]|uniref:ABC transporter substrate-binding protein n=1 Tax=Streptomyces phytophilus TaxID=722715 RepID=UPI0015F0B496|nr:ABC transporter substrate-binding protein [Streptomyces phytophilus]
MERLDAVIDQLSFRRRFVRGRVRFERGAGALLLQVEGEAELLGEWCTGLLARYRGVVPMNHPSDIEASTEELEVVRRLHGIAEGCGGVGRVARGLPLVFPRFAAARTALYEWSPIDEELPERHIPDLDRHIKDAIAAERRRTRSETARRFETAGRSEHVRGLMGGWVGAVLELANVLRFPYGRTLRWYRQRFGVRTNAAACERLLRYRDEPADAKVTLLVEALLADVDAHYGLVRRLNRARRPVVLLPDVDTVPARRIIRDTVLSLSDGRSRGLRVSPLVVTTARPGGAEPVHGAREAVATDELARAIPDRYRDRERIGKLRSQGGDDELPGRLLQVRLETAGPGRQREPSGRRSWGPLTAAAAVVVLGTAGVLGYLLLFGEPESCGAGLYVQDGECIGVSDGTGVFMPDVEGMPEVSARIAEQNEAVAGEKHATVALLIPLESDNAAVQRQILSEVQGAYLAQARANSADSVKPPIRLVLANPGRGYGHWHKAVEQLDRDEPGLRAVVGFNLSLKPTKAALEYVTREMRVPAVASVVTADDFANPEGTDQVPYPGLARVVSTTRDQAQALLAFDRDLAGAETALVADYRPGDNYNRSLRETFGAARDSAGAGGDGQGTGVQDMRFTSPGVEEEGYTANEFEDFAANICRSRADVVYFAGRAFHLELFVKKLANTYCREKPAYTVITGSDATTLDRRLSDTERAALRGDPGAGKPSVTIRYAAPAHPDTWATELARWQDSHPSEAEPPLYLRESADAMTTLRQDIAALEGAIGEVQLDDGRTIVTHDVVLTASRALARAVHTSEQDVPSAERVRMDLGKLNSDLRVRGASGLVCLTNAGNPYNKALAVVEVEPHSKKVTLDGVAWPTGRAPARDDSCIIPAQP